MDSENPCKRLAARRASGEPSAATQLLFYGESQPTSSPNRTSCYILRNSWTDQLNAESSTVFERLQSSDGREDLILIRYGCESNCTGSPNFCEQVPWDTTASCHCETKEVVYDLSHIASIPSFINPTTLTVPVCIFTRTITRKPRRQLLEFESATFSKNTLNISFHDPVVTVPTADKLIARISGKEVIFDVQTTTIVFSL